MGGRDVVSFSRSAGAGPAPPPWEGEAVGDRAEFKLPMLGKCMKLRPLPDQDPRREYGVIWDSCRQPGEGWGYVFEFTGKRRGRILAWMTAGGAAYACDEPLAYVPEGEPDVLASRLPEDENAGQVEARSGRGLPLRLASRYRRVPRTGTFAFEQPACDLGSYAGSKLDLRTFLAVAFLAFVHLPQESGAAVPCGRMADVVDDLLKPPLPDACDLLVHRVRSARPGGASGFELYAARLLEEAGSSRLRAIAAHADIGAGRLSTTGLAWLRFDEDALDGEERNAVLAVESALNRLALIEASVAAADGAGALYAGYDEGFCSELDWRALCGIAAGAGALARGSGQPNEPRGMFGVQAAQGGEWDVRTRFAQACEGLRLPFRLEYRFDADAAAGVLAVECSAPLPGAFPAARWDAARAMWEDVRALRGWAASAYAMRLAAVLAAAAFGAGIGMARAVVTVRPGSLGGQAGMSLAFDRIPFLADVLPRIEAGALADPVVACDPAAVLALLDPADRSTGVSGERLLRHRAAPRRRPGGAPPAVDGRAPAARLPFRHAARRPGLRAGRAPRRGRRPDRAGGRGARRGGVLAARLHRRAGGAVGARRRAGVRTRPRRRSRGRRPGRLRRPGRWRTYAAVLREPRRPRPRGARGRRCGHALPQGLRRRVRRPQRPLAALPESGRRAPGLGGRRGLQVVGAHLAARLPRRRVRAHGRGALRRGGGVAARARSALPSAVRKAPTCATGWPTRYGGRGASSRRSPAMRRWPTGAVRWRGRRRRRWPTL